MNIRQVLRAYSLLRQLTDDESALLETLRSMTDAERELLVETLAPQKSTTTKKPTTEHKIEHCVACDYTKRAAVHKDPNADGYHGFQSAKDEKKSKRAANLAATVRSSLARRGPTVSGFADDTDMQRCVHSHLSGQPCGLLPDHNVHHLQSAMGYHEFDAGKSPAPRAGAKSSTNGGATVTTVNSEDETVSAGAVAGGSGE